MNEVPQPEPDRIRNRADYERFLKADLAARGMTRLPLLYWYRNPLIHYMVMLRKCEYLHATARTRFAKARLKLLSIRRRRAGARLGISMAINTCGPGLYIAHWGSVVVSAEARIGANVTLHTPVTITRNPVIGDRVYFAPGSVVTGDIRIGDDAKIGANSVVARDVPAGATVMGNPGRVIK